MGLDWFIFSTCSCGSTLIFIFVEKLLALRKEQPVFRPEWQTDMHHFIVTHLVVGFILLATNLLVHKLFGWAAKDSIQAWAAIVSGGTVCHHSRCRPGAILDASRLS